MAAPWEKDPIVQPAAPVQPGGLRQIVAPQPDRPNAQTPAQETGDILSVERTRQQINQDADNPQNEMLVRAATLRAEFDKRGPVATYRRSLPIFADTISTVLKSRKQPTAADDLKLVYNFAKLMDPESVVRESETQSVQDLGSVGQQWYTKFSKEIDPSTGLLPSGVREQIASTLAARMGTYNTGYRSERQAFAELAKKSNITDPTLVVLPHEGEAFRSIYDQWRGVGAGSAQPKAPLGPGDIGFEMDPQGNPLRPEHQAAYDAFWGANPNATAEQLQQFVRSLGYPGIENAEAIIAARDKGAGVRGAADATYGKADISEARGGARPILPLAGLGVTTETPDAMIRGTADVLTLGMADEIAAAGNTIFSGGTMAENLERERAIDAYDEQNNAGARFTGQMGAAFAIPTSVRQAAIASAKRIFAAGGTRAEALAAARVAATRRLSVEGAGVGGAYGAGSAEGDLVDRAAHGAVSAAVGGAAGYSLGWAGGRFLNRGGGRAPPADLDQLETAQAATELGIDLPRFIAGGVTAQRAGARAEQTPFGAATISGARRLVGEQAQAARDTIAQGAGRAAEPEEMGEAAVRGAREWRTGSSVEGRKLYRRAAKLAEGVSVKPQNTMQLLSRLIREESGVPGGTEALPIIERYASAFENGGTISVDGARKMRTTLRQRLGETMAPSDAQRLTAAIMSAVGKDIETSLQAAGRKGAVTAYRSADRFWAERMEIIEDVMRPIVGKDGENWGSAVARALSVDAKGNGARLSAFLRTIPKEEAGTIRATLISRLGRAGSGQQNPDGEVFSLDTFLTHWDQIRGAREQIFERETVRALNRLAIVANRVKAANSVRNHSNTGGTVSAVFSAMPATSGITAGYVTGSPVALAAGVIGSVAIGLGQFAGARMLASAAFAQRLSATPMTPRGASAYWSRPWVAKLARQEPAIGTEILGFQDAVLTGLGREALPAAASGGNREEQAK